MLEYSGMSRNKKALDRAIKRVGGPAALAKGLSISTQAVVQWDEVPPLRVIAVEKLSGVSRSELRPDLYPAEETAA